MIGPYTVYYGLYKHHILCKLNVSILNIYNPLITTEQGGHINYYEDLMSTFVSLVQLEFGTGGHYKWHCNFGFILSIILGYIDVNQHTIN
jgi:hypothetical protein